MFLSLIFTVDGAPLVFFPGLENMTGWPGKYKMKMRWGSKDSSEYPDLEI